MHHFKYALVCIALVLTTFAFAGDEDIKSAERVANRYLELNFSGDYAGAAELIDEASLNTAIAYVMQIVQQAKDSGQPKYIEQMGITLSPEALQRLSPREFYVKVIAPMPPGSEQLKASLKTAKISVVESKLLPNGAAQVGLSFVTSSSPQPQRANILLRRNGSEWKVQIG